MSFHFGWSIDYILGLSTIQFAIASENLGKILRQKYDPDYKEEDDVEKEKKLNEILIEREKKLKAKGKSKPRKII